MAPIPCLKGCGFFGDPEQRNLCSQCYKDEILAPLRASIQDQINREMAMKNLRAQPLPPLPRIKTKIVTKITKRCESCKRKIGLTGFRCKCGGEFCSAHRLPESLAAEKDSLDIIQHDWALPKIEHDAEQVLRKLLRTCQEINSTCDIAKKPQGCVNEKWKRQIEKDLPRTILGHPTLDEDGRNALRRLLTAYARHDPLVGYYQAGHEFLCKHIIGADAQGKCILNFIGHN